MRSLLFNRIAPCLLLIWLIVVVLMLFNINPDPGRTNNLTQILFYGMSLWMVKKVYSECPAETKKILFFLFLAVGFAFITDMINYLYMYTFNNFNFFNAKSNVIEHDAINKLLYYYDYVEMIVWYSIVFLFVLNLIKKNFLDENIKKKQFISVYLYSVLFLASIVYLKMSYTESKYTNFSYYVLLCTFIEINTYLICIYGLIHSKSKSLIFLLSSIIVMVATQISALFYYHSHTHDLITFAYITGTLWPIMIFLSLLFIYETKDYVLQTWFISPNTLESRLAVSTLVISNSSFILFFIISSAFGMVDHNKNIYFLLFCMIYNLIAIFFSKSIAWSFAKPFKDLKTSIENLISTKKYVLNDKFTFYEFDFLQNFIYMRFMEYVSKEEKLKRFGKVAVQVAHDIRSPVSAILMLAKESAELPEEPRVILRDAAHRIQDITNNLLDKTREENTNTSADNIVMFLASTAVLSVISEKKIEYKNAKVEILHDFETDAIFCFIQANVREFKRVLSNLLNNAIESMNAIGKITVHLWCSHSVMHIDIIDSGEGMAQSVVDAIMRGEPISNKQTGLGLGLSHARSFLLASHAQLSISSSMPSGTTVSLIFNRQFNASCWIANEISFKTSSIIVILDDDISIHGAWDSLFSCFFKEMQITPKVVHFTQGIACLEFLKQLSEADFEEVLMLTDYELIKQSLNGLDIIRISGLNKAILVTSYYDDNEIIKKSMLLNVQVLPKILVSEVKLSLRVDEIELDKESANLVMVEDNKVFSEVVSYLYEYQGKSLNVYHDSYSLFNNLHRYDKINTKFCLDFDLGTAINGIELAAVLHERGFKQLYLISGYKIEVSEVPSYLQVLTSKMELLNL